MALNTEQKTILADHIRASVDADVITALADRNDVEMARLYNLDSSFTIWNSNITPAAYRAVMVWTEVDNMNTGDARIWEWITANMTLPIDSSEANVRQGLNDAFQTSAGTKAALLLLAKILASLAESLYATGTGTNANPGVLTFAGNVSTADVSKALNENP